MSTAKVYLKEFAFLDETSRNTNDHASNPAVLESQDLLLLGFDALPESMQFKRISSYPTLSVYIKKLVDTADPSYPYCTLYSETAFRKFDPLSATYANSQDLIDSFKTASSIFKEGVEGTGWLTFARGLVPRASALNCGAMLKHLSASNTISIVTQGTQRPYLTVEVDDSDTLGVEVSDCTPSSGTIARTAPAIFAWAAKGDKYNCAPATDVASSVLQWRIGSDGDINNVQVPGSAKTITIPANTFPAAELQWRVSVTANSGVVTTSDWMTVSTLDGTPTAKVVSPENTFVDATIDNTFIWAHIISTGTSQTKAELQTSTNGLTWSTLATITGAATQWVCPAGTLSSAVKYWRVRTYNADGVASEWSDAAQIVVVSAPPTPAIQILNASPRPEISWQTTGQQAAQVSIDGVYDSGTIYGTAQRWTCPVYLPDGDYTVRVRAQNEYGLWSTWGAAAIPVANVPGAGITLTARAANEALLTWETTGAYDFYLVYRDDSPIAKLSGTSYIDKLSVGVTRYQIRGCYADSGNYGISETASVRITPDTVIVSDFDTGEWIALRYAATQNRKTSRARTRTVNYVSLSGVRFPIAEASENYTDALTVEAACIDADMCRIVDDLLGKLVCVKTPTEDIAIGYLDNLTKDHDGFVYTYAFTVQQIDYSEEVQL